MGGSSSASRRRKLSHRRNPPSIPRLHPTAPIAPTTAHRLTFNSLAITEGIGYDLLLKSGWHPGSPLGQSPLQSSTPPSTPATAPLPILVNPGRAGLGARQTIVDDDSPDRLLAPRSAPEKRLHISARLHTPQQLRRVASVELFDPLRPRCRYDSSHVVRNLKMLRKHESTCPANPLRGGHHHHDHEDEPGEHVVTLSNLFDQMELNTSASSSNHLPHDHDDHDDAILSDLSHDDDISTVASAYEYTPPPPSFDTSDHHHHNDHDDMLASVHCEDIDSRLTLGRSL